MKRCLIVIDYQNDFVTGSLGFKAAEKLDDRIAERIQEYRRSGGDVIFTLDTHGDNYLSTHEGRYLPVVHCIKGSEGHALFGKTGMSRKDTDKVFEKATFGSEELFEYLKTTPYESIEFCGVVSDICVLTNVALARTAQPEAEILVHAGLVASNDPARNQAAFSVMESLQVRVIYREGEKDE